MRRDRARDREAANVGWQTLRVLDEEVESCADVVLRDLLTTYAIRTEQVRSTA